jgi:hypothetical protein
MLRLYIAPSSPSSPPHPFCQTEKVCVIQRNINKRKLIPIFTFPIVYDGSYDPTVLQRHQKIFSNRRCYRKPLLATGSDPG